MQSCRPTKSIFGMLAWINQSLCFTSLLKRFPQMAGTRQALARRYDELLCNHTRIQRIHHNYDVVVPHIYVVRIKGIANREKLREQLLKSGIQTGVHYQPNHLPSFYQDSKASPLPQTDSTYPELLSLPLHTDLNAKDVNFICEKLKSLI